VIKGIPANCLDFYIQTKIDEIGLTDMADNQVKTYSRGNKRKLTFTMALIGNPSIVLLDEPSNGMTPVDKK
jgi:ABC-type multidrug transport system ATPase subunit